MIIFFTPVMQQSRNILGDGLRSNKIKITLSKDLILTFKLSFLYSFEKQLHKVTIRFVLRGLISAVFTISQ
jgi:hypothetical protein